MSCSAMNACVYSINDERRLMLMLAVDSLRLTSSFSMPGIMSASCPVAIAWPDTSNTFHWSSDSFLPDQVSPESAI